jgi:hypothetical protein
MVKGEDQVCFSAIPRDHGNDSTGSCDGDGEPDDGSKRGWPRPLSFRIETNARPNIVKPRSTISQKLEALNG